MYLKGTDYRSIWALSHQWKGYDPEISGNESPPEEVQDLIQRLISGHFRGDFPLRKGSGFLIDPKENSLLINLFVSLPLMFKLRKFQTRNEFNKELLNNLYVRRGEILGWCQKEFLAPPLCWTPETNDANQSPANTPEGADDDSDKDGWYEKLTDRRKQLAATLEIAKQLWKEEPKQTYEDILKHPVMIRFGYPKIFTLDSFKRWARPFATEYAKNGGRRKESDS